MSNLLVQNIKHTNATTSMAIDTSGQVTIRGEGSATTTNLQQGLCKVWVKFDGTDTGSGYHDSLNASSLTDHATGEFQVFITNDMGNDDYATFVTSTFYSGMSSEAHTIVGSVRIFTADANGNVSDREETTTCIFGDLA